MARSVFGGGAQDFAFGTVSAAGYNVMKTLPSFAVTFWSAKTGGTQYTDLLLGADGSGGAASSVTTDARGLLPEFQGPDGVILMWADAGTTRVKVTQADLSATYVPLAGAAVKTGGLRLSDSFPEVKGTSEATVTYATTDPNAAAWQAVLSGPGRLFHFRIADAAMTGTLIGLGCDYGNSSYPSGLLVANKAQSRGVVIDQQSTVTDASAYGLYVRNSSTTTPAALFEQEVAGAFPAIQLVALQASANQKLAAFRSNTGSGTTEECGIFRADNGWLLWNKVIRPGQYTSAGRTAISGLGSSTRGSAVYNTDKQQSEVFTDLGWRSLAYSRPVATKTANYNMALGDGIIVSNGTGLTISLPDPTTVINDGAIFTVKNINASAATVNSQGTSKTIDGAASVSLAQWAAGRYVSDGTQWLIV